MDAMTCRCPELEAVEGATARAYTDGHLVERALGEGANRDLLAAGIRCWRCPDTGWQYESSPVGGGPMRRLRRLPFTTADDYLRHDVVAARAADLAAAPQGSEAYRHARDALYSPDLYALIQSVNRSDPTGIEAAIVLLEVDPWCFRSGYLKVSVMDHLARARLQPDDRRRIQVALVAAALKGPRRADEHRSLLRLARHVRLPEFAERLEALRVEVPASKQPTIDRLIEALAQSRRGPARRHRRRG